MMYNYPFFSFPHFRRYANYYTPYSPYISQPINIQNHNSVNNDKILNKSNEIKKEKSSSKKAPSGFNFLNNFFNQSDRNDKEEYFDLLGLKLYYDDLLLIGLIFFLYKEDVKDQYLFFALILLLLS